MKVGILGGGQLARMMIQAGEPLGLSFKVFDSSLHTSTKDLVPCTEADFNDEDALKLFISDLDVVTYEFENIPDATVEYLEKNIPCYPGATALKVSQDRLSEKTLCRNLGVETASFIEINSKKELRFGAEKLGLPCILKLRSLGYDGKGQYVLRADSDIEKAWELLGEAPLILEGFVNFDRELSIVGAFGKDNNTSSFYPLVQNVHTNGILDTTTAPAPGVSSELQTKAEQICKTIAEQLSYVGVICIELFQVNDTLAVNEMAPRVHNSGHWTIEGAKTSQFENHLRAICGMELGDTSVVIPSVMKNIIGSFPDSLRSLSSENYHLHDYCKEPRDGRKLGHLTVTGEQALEFLKQLEPK